MTRTCEICQRELPEEQLVRKVMDNFIFYLCPECAVVVVGDDR